VVREICGDQPWPDLVNCSLTTVVCPVSLLRCSAVSTWLGGNAQMIVNRAGETYLGKSLESGGEGSRTLCLRLPKLFIKCNCLGEFDIIGPQKPARLLRKRHAMAHTGHTPTAFQSRERRRCQSPLGDSNGRAAIRAPRLRRLMDFHLLRHSYGTYRAAIPSGCSWRGLPQPSQAGDHEFSRASRRSRNC
jgi:hypothetical protein